MTNKPFKRPRHWTLEQTISHYSSAIPSGCIVWTGALFKTGYGALNWNRRAQYAHRLMWEFVNGPIPADHFVCHTCDVPACVNPAHLFLGTNADNVADMVAKGRQARGSKKVGQAKLTEEQALAIYNAPGVHRIIGKQFGISGSVVTEIKNRKGWRHIHLA